MMARKEKYLGDVESTEIAGTYLRRKRAQPMSLKGFEQKLFQLIAQECPQKVTFENVHPIAEKLQVFLSFF